MPRKSRNFYMSNLFHIMVQGDERKFIFEKGYYKEKYIYLLMRNAFRNDVKIIAYCVMDNHVHILVHTKEYERMSKMMSQCNTAYGIYYSKKRQNVGHVFRDRFKSEAIYDKRYLINCIKYIHENPVKANIIKKAKDYSYSSYRYYEARENEFCEEAKDVCYLTDEEINDITQNSHAEIDYMDADEREKIQQFLNELKEEYDIANLTIEQIGEIYTKISQRYNVKKSEIARVLNMNRTTFNYKLKKFVEKGASLPTASLPTKKFVEKGASLPTKE